MPRYPDPLRTVSVGELLAQAARLHQLNRLAEAEDLYQRITRLRPHHQAATFNIALIQAQSGRLSSARHALEGLLKSSPADPESHHLLAKIQERQGDLKQAAYHLLQVTRLVSSRLEPWLDLLRIYGRAGRIAEARKAAEHALDQFPNHQEVRLQLAIVLEASGIREEAKSLFESILSETPTQPQALYHLARIADAEGCAGAALEMYRCAQANDREHKLPALILADLELRLGYVEDAIRDYTAWSAAHPDHADVCSGRIFAAQYQPGVTPERLLDLHKAWDARFGHPAKLQAAAPAKQHARHDGRMRVAVVSGDLREHPVGFLTIRAFETLDASAINLFAYADSRSEDGMTRRFRAAMPNWRDVADWSDERLATEIRRDRIDVLFDLAGHSSPSRLPALAFHPAATQITWAGYVGTTGLAVMDGILADRFHIPPGEERHYVERVLRMPDSYSCFDPPADAPAVAELPAGASDPLTFAAFHHPAKINAEVARLWARILSMEPGSSIRFIYAGFDSAAVQQRIRNWFAEAGAEPDRLHFEGRLPRRELLARYAAVDMALDPFPYSGGVTTCEALWMGVPVVTMPGRTFAGRHSLSYLSTLGLQAFVADDPDGYLSIVRHWSSDREQLAALRRDLRMRFARSPLCDAPRFARNLQMLLQDMVGTAVAG